jgi:anti-sigma factor RsiW
VNTSNDCERVRIALMASLDGERDARSAQDQQHLSTCSACRRWLEEMHAMTGRLQGLAYPSAQTDLWATVGSRIRQPEQPSLLRRLWPIAFIVLGWRALQLWVDLPIPLLHPLVPLAAAAVAVWLLEGDPLAIETSAPELQTRGV